MKRLFFPLLFLFTLLRAEEPIDIKIYEKATESLYQKDIENSLNMFKQMIKLGVGDLYTVQAYLVCDEKDLISMIDMLKEKGKKEVFIIKRLIDSKVCYRLCIGFFRNKKEADQFLKGLPSPFKEAKPYTLLLVSKGRLNERAFPSDFKDYSKEELKYENSLVEEKRFEKKEEVSLAQEYFLKGIEAYTLKDYIKAEKFFKDSISLNPNRVEVYNNLGIVLLEQGKIVEAREVLEKGEMINPFYANIRANLSGVYWALGLRDKAIEEAEKAIRLEPSKAQYYLNLGAFFIEMGNLEKAKIYINAAKLLEPDSEDIKRLEEKLSGVKDEEQSNKNDEDNSALQKKSKKGKRG